MKKGIKFTSDVKLFMYLWNTFDFICEYMTDCLQFCGHYFINQYKHKIMFHDMY